MTLIIVVIVAILLYVIIAYNGMIKLRNQVKEAWADIDVQLKRRYNLIPNIVETVKGYAAHESDVMTKVTEARANAINATNIKDQGAAENMLSGALKSLFAVAENYPQLKANENFLQLQNELVDTEDKIQSARRFYNGVTRDFNTKVQQFPAKIIAQLFKFKAEDFFEIEDEEQRENVEVSFDKDKGEKAAKSPKEDEKEEAPTEKKAEEKEESKEEEKKDEAPAEPEAEEKKEEPKEEEKPSEPEKCPKCGGEMTDDHVCPVAEEEKPEEKEGPKEEEKKEEPEEEPAKEEKEEEKPEEEKPAEPEAEEKAEEKEEEEKKEEGSEQNALPLEHSDDKK